MTPVQYGGQVRHRPNRALNIQGRHATLSRRGISHVASTFAKGRRASGTTFSKSTYNSPPVIGWGHWTKDSEKKNQMAGAEALTNVCAVENRGVKQRGIKYLSQKHMENKGDKNETKTLISGGCLNRSGPSPHVVVPLPLV